MKGRIFFFFALIPSWWKKLQVEPMAILMENSALRNRTGIFADRSDAGKQLAQMLRDTVKRDSLVLAIPSGGVPVGLAVARILALDFDLLLVRKVQIPWNSEAGFAAVNLDSDLFVNEHLLSMLNLSADQIERQVKKTMSTVAQRNRKFRQNRPFPDIDGRSVILVDDGLASGYTMRAAIAYVRKRNPAAITLAVPTGSADTVKMLLPETETLCCLNVRESYPYSVAAAYRNWYDLTDDDVLHMLAVRDK
jgi:putative phosphoribosyl transferase